MHFEPNDDQTTFLDFLDQMSASNAAAWAVSSDRQRFQWSSGLDATLERNGFYDAAKEQSLGPTTAAAMIYRLAQLPVTVECAASAMLRAVFAPDLPRPVAVIEGKPDSPIRFLPLAKSVIWLELDAVRVAPLAEGDTAPIDSLFAYPMGVIRREITDAKTIDVDPAEILDFWRIAVAAEIAGALKGGLESVLAHVRERRQFGRPLGSFQAIQHRLATSAAKIEGAYWLTLKAAQRLNPTDAATALGYAQDISTAVVYDLHQFMGAMGLTLEHPLHRWTYRARLLRSSLGGASVNFRTVSERRWRAA